MRHLKLFETFKAKKHFNVTNRKSRDGNLYYFTSENDWEYEVGFYRTEENSYFFGFKAKRPEEHFYNTDTITNDNPYKVLPTMKYIFEEHYEKYKPNKYIFSIQGDKRFGKKRESVYLKMLQQMPEWIVTKDPNMTRWYLKRK